MRSFIGASVNGKPTVSKTVTAGSTPAAPAELVVGLTRWKKLMSIFSKPVVFVKEVRQELGKVSWSSRQELIGSTLVVITVTAILAVFIGVIDIVLSKFLSLLFR